jgi:hypothetical protein
LTTLLDEFRPAPLPIKVRAFLDFAAPRLKRVFAD